MDDNPPGQPLGGPAPPTNPHRRTLFQLKSGFHSHWSVSLPHSSSLLDTSWALPLAPPKPREQAGAHLGLLPGPRGSAARHRGTLGQTSERHVPWPGPWWERQRPGGGPAPQKAWQQLSWPSRQGGSSEAGSPRPLWTHDRLSGPAGN